MHDFLNTLRALLLLATLGLACAARAEEAVGASEPAAESRSGNLFNSESLFDRLRDRVRFSGFARLVGGYLDVGGVNYVEDVHYEGYTDAISFGQDSLFALQTDVELTETFSFTTQLLAHTSATRESGVEWAYLTWRPSKSWRFRAGKLRTPFYLHSDTLDVGFSYPWIIPPPHIYTPYMPNDFTGLSAAYQFNIRDWSIETKAYWGNFEGAVTVTEKSPADLKTDNLRGLILEAQRGNLHLRASYNRTVVTLTVPALARLVGPLRQFGFNRSADSLNTKADTTLILAGVSYETLDYFLKAEWSRMAGPVAFRVPRFDGYYLSGGYTFYPFNLPITAHATYARHDGKFQGRPVDEIPAGVSPRLAAAAPRLAARRAAQLATLRSAYNSVFDSRSTSGDSLQSLGVGLRWDINPAVALKAEWTYLVGERDKRSFFTAGRAFDRKANLFLLGLEWIF